MSPPQLITVSLLLLAAAHATVRHVGDLESLERTLERHVPELPPLDESPPPPPPLQPPLLRVAEFKHLLSPRESPPRPSVEHHSTPSTPPFPSSPPLTSSQEVEGAEKLGGTRQLPGRKHTVKTARRLRQEAIPPALRQEYAALPPLVGPNGRLDTGSHAKFWTKVVALRDSNFDNVEKQRATTFIRRELRVSARKPPPEDRKHNRQRPFHMPHHLSETMKELAARHTPPPTSGPRSTKRVDVALRPELGEHPPAFTPPLTREANAGRTRELLQAAIARTDPSRQVSNYHVAHAERYIHGRLRRLEEARLQAQREGRGPPGSRCADSRCHEAEDVLQLAARELGKKKYAAQSDAGAPASELQWPSRSSD